MVGDAMPQPIFHELFVSISELQETLLPDFDLGSSPWLFRELTETLDHRILILLTRHEGHRLAGDISINLNVQTVLAPEFLAFDDFVRARQGRTVVLELQKVDIFADLAAFQYARDFVRERGYRVCIDGVTADSLALIDRERFGVDLVKIPWSPVFTGASGDVNHQLADYVAKSGSSGVVLCHCDTASSIFVGQSAGISFFQGRHVDSLLDPGKTRSRSPVPR